ncbi:MAG: NADH-quinone oxidoreductase subunit C/D [bacterium]|nr:NADH-quinone oxidoreductase subunit C/D [bacterium]
MSTRQPIATCLRERFPDAVLAKQSTADLIETVWVKPSYIVDVIQFLKYEIPMPFKMLYDLTAIDEHERKHREGQPQGRFTVVYHLLSFDRNQDVRIKIPLEGNHPHTDSINRLFPNANWYEREVWDMFGIHFDGHPFLQRLLMPFSWKGHPLRKEHPARATELAPYQLPEEQEIRDQKDLQFKPEDWGLKTHSSDEEYMFLNLGPQHPGTHGVLRLILQLNGEEILDTVCDIGFHHRGAEKMGERQTWHCYIPYTDRIDYLGGVMNNLPYVLALEQLGKIAIPERASVIRVMLCELFRIASHLVWYGTFAQDVGAMSPVLYMFSDREYILKIIEGITGGRMHPSWFRIGGIAADLPIGWKEPILAFLKYMPKRLKEYDGLVMQNSIFKGRTVGVGAYNQQEAIDWGITGAGLRATGLDWDLRKKRPYSGYENYDFDIPVATKGDCYARAQVRIEEIRQSLRIIEQCVNNMPEGQYKSDNPLTTPPRKEQTLLHIDTLINHFLNVTWGPVMPINETFFAVEASKGSNGYYLISDGSTQSFRTRIRSPSFPNLQMLPLLAQGGSISDLMATLGSIDFVLADVDR